MTTDDVTVSGTDELNEAHAGNTLVHTLDRASSGWEMGEFSFAEFVRRVHEAALDAGAHSQAFAQGAEWYDERVQAMAAALLADGDDLPPDNEWARDFMASKVGHAGTCPHVEKREPFNCVACTREDMTRRARAIMACVFPELFAVPPPSSPEPQKGADADKVT